MIVAVILFLVVLVNLSTTTVMGDFVLNEALTVKIRYILRTVPTFNLEMESTENVDGNVYVDYFLRRQDQSAVVVRNCVGVCARVRSKMELDRNEIIQNFVVVSSNETLDGAIQSYTDLKGSFFFILTDNISQEIAEDLLRSIWMKFEIYKIYLLTGDGGFLYNPFYYSYDKKRYGKLMNMEEISISALFDNLNGFPLSVQIFRSVYAKPIFDKDNRVLSVEGADAEVAYLLADKMNFTMMLQEPETDFFGDRYPNGTYYGTLGRLIRREVNMSLTGFFVKDYLTRDIEFSVSVYIDNLCCYVPKADRIPQSILPLFSVRLIFWLAFILTGFACGFIWLLFRATNLRIFERNPLSLDMLRHIQICRIFTDTWVLWVRVAINRIPPYSSECLFIMYISFLSMIFGAIFESSLATVFIKPLYYKDINSLHDLDIAGLTVFYRHAAMKNDLFIADTPGTFRNLQKKLKFATDTKEPLIKTMSTRGGFASVTRGSSLNLDDIIYFMSNKIHKVAECPKDYQIAYVLPKDSPFSKRINYMLLRCLGAGLIDHWIGQMLYKARLEATSALDFTNFETGRRVLTLSDLQLAFYVILLGTLLSGIALLIEIYVNYKRLKK